MDFNARMAELPEPPNDSHPPLWDFWRHDLWARGQVEPPENFTEWPCIYHTMLVRHFPMADRWEKLPDKYRAIIAPLPEPFHGNAIEQSWSLYQWGRDVADLDTIYELGGGFGQMAWLCRQLGFKGRYVIRDLPEFELLQRWWLRDVEVEWAQEPEPCDLFIACYSLSEIPMGERLAMIPESPHCCYIYTENWAYGDNRAWFLKNVPGTHIPMEDRPGNWYLVR